MEYWYHTKLSKAEKEVIIASNVFEFAWFSTVVAKKWLKNATRAKMMGDHVYLEDFDVEHHPGHHVWSPRFGS